VVAALGASAPELHERFTRNYAEGILINPEHSAAALPAHLAGDDTGTGSMERLAHVVPFRGSACRVLVVARGLRRAGVAAAAFPDNELGGEPLGPWRQCRMGYPLQQAGAGALADQPHRLADRGQ
jgi:hypothetical protein